MGAVALNGYLIRRANLPLLRNGEPLSDLERRQRMVSWHKINALRLLLLAAGWAVRPSR